MHPAATAAGLPGASSAVFPITRAPGWRREGRRRRRARARFAQAASHLATRGADRLLALLTEDRKAQGLVLDMMDTSFFIGKETLIPKMDSEMAFWREKLFITLFRNADSVTNYFKLPPNRVVELGAQVTL